MDWPATLPTSDVLITQEEAVAVRPRYVVYVRATVPVVFQSYVEAEGHALRCAHESGGHVWYNDGRRFQMVMSTMVRLGA